MNVGIVVFNRYDLLFNLMQSIGKSRVLPRSVYIIDRGHQPVEIERCTAEIPLTIPVITIPLGGQSLPDAWNWFLVNVPDCIIASDDIEFFPETIETFRDTPGDFVGLDDGKSSAYACFMVRASGIEKVGLFDNTLAPDYMYFEDCDHHHRGKLLGMSVASIGCMSHGLCQSWVKKTPEQQAAHHPQFHAAEARYIAKWGGKPGDETFTTPFNSGSDLRIQAQQETTA